MHRLATLGFSISVGVSAVALTSGCQPSTTVARTVGPAEPAQRAAVSFVHCVEQDGGGCVTRDPLHVSWDAFALLNWLGAGSPTSILLGLRREVEHHSDRLAVQDRLVSVAARYREPLRGAECKPESATPLTELLPRVVARVQARMQSLGLWRPDFEELVASLAGEATAGLDGGWLVHMTCYGDPYELWLATAKRDERQVVVGILSSLPAYLGGEPLSDDFVEGRIRARSSGSSVNIGVVREGAVDSRWMPFSIEEL